MLTNVENYDDLIDVRTKWKHLVELVFEVLFSHFSYFGQKCQSFEKSKVVVIYLKFTENKFGVRSISEYFVLLHQKMSQLSFTLLSRAICIHLKLI